MSPLRATEETPTNSCELPPPKMVTYPASSEEADPKYRLYFACKRIGEETSLTENGG